MFSRLEWNDLDYCNKSYRSKQYLWS